MTARWAFAYPKQFFLFGENKKELIENWKKIILNGYDKIFPATGKEVMARDLIRRLGKDEKNRI